MEHGLSRSDRRWQRASRVGAGAGLARPAGSCTEVIMVESPDDSGRGRRACAPGDHGYQHRILFPATSAELARTCSAPGEPLYAAPAIGIGKGSSALEWMRTSGNWRSAWLARLRAAAWRQESNASDCFRQPGGGPKSGFAMRASWGKRKSAVRSVGFKRLAIFRPGIIAGNAHTPGFVAALGRFIPGSFGTIDQDDIGRAFVVSFSTAGTAR